MCKRAMRCEPTRSNRPTSLTLSIGEVITGTNSLIAFTKHTSLISTGFNILACCLPLSCATVCAGCNLLIDVRSWHLADNPAPLLVRMGLSRDVAYWQIVLQKSFCTADQKFSGL